MLLHPPGMDVHGVDTPVKNGPAVVGHGAEAVRDASMCKIVTLPAYLRLSLAQDLEMDIARHVRLRIKTGCWSTSVIRRDLGSAAPRKNQQVAATLLLKKYYPRDA